ncbi:type IV pilin protein [Ectothiorhodospiraceae bacterium WFHF3C12]|nr:type IV pilin protein [Ectothiorhodospiraceae bacterium WFHF3C12]
MQAREKGVTLLELMIVVAIIGILAGIAYPSYQTHVTETRRTDAMGALNGLAAAMERYYTENLSYEGAAAGGADTGAPDIFPTQAPLDGNRKFYDLTIQTLPSSDSYVLRATPINGQVGDGYLELTNAGARRWDRNNNGAIDAGEDCWDDSC